MNAVNKVKGYINWELVISGLVTSAVVGVAVYGLRTAGLSKAAAVVKGG